MTHLNEKAIFKIVSKKHDCSFHRSWEENFLLFDHRDVIIGGNYQTNVTESTSKIWRTNQPALFYFSKKHWFNIIVIFDENDYFYYCNISSPFTWIHNELHYIDYDIDIIVQADYSYEVKDETEYEENCQKYRYPRSIQVEIMRGKNELIEMIKKRDMPFNKTFIEKWRPKFFDLLNHI